MNYHPSSEDDTFFGTNSQHNENSNRSRRGRGRYGSSLTFVEMGVQGNQNRNVFFPERPKQPRRKQAPSFGKQSVAKESTVSSPEYADNRYGHRRGQYENISFLHQSQENLPSTPESRLNSLLGVHEEHDDEQEEIIQIPERPRNADRRTGRIGRRASLQRDVEIASTMRRNKKAARRRIPSIEADEEDRASDRRRRLRLTGSERSKMKDLSETLRRQEKNCEENRDSFLVPVLERNESALEDMRLPRKALLSVQSFAPPNAGMRESESPFQGVRAALKSRPMHQLTLGRNGEIEIIDFDDILPNGKKRTKGNTLMRTMKRMVGKKKP